MTSMKDYTGASDDPVTLEFYENEVKRLGKLHDFVKNKLKNKRQYSQTRKLREMTEKELDQVRSLIIEKCLQKDSIFYQNLTNLFNYSFSERTENWQKENSR